VGFTTFERTAEAVDAIEAGKPSVWGGDWNHALSGPEQAGSRGGREHVLDAIQQLGLQVPTADLPHWIDGHLSIDHIAVGRKETVTAARRLPAREQGLSDHDCYVVEVETGA